MLKVLSVALLATAAAGAAHAGSVKTIEAPTCKVATHRPRSYFGIITYRRIRRILESKGYTVASARVGEGADFLLNTVEEESCRPFVGCTEWDRWSFSQYAPAFGAYEHYRTFAGEDHDGMSRWRRKRERSKTLAEIRSVPGCRPDPDHWKPSPGEAPRCHAGLGRFRAEPGNRCSTEMRVELENVAVKRSGGRLSLTAVRDLATGDVWMQSSSRDLWVSDPSNVSETCARIAAENGVPGNGWRLPTLELVEEAYSHGVTETLLYDRGHSVRHWTATPAPEAEGALVTFMLTGGKIVRNASEGPGGISWSRPSSARNHSNGALCVASVE